MPLSYPGAFHRKGSAQKYYSPRSLWRLKVLSGRMSWMSKSGGKWKAFRTSSLTSITGRSGSISISFSASSVGTPESRNRYFVKILALCPILFVQHIEIAVVSGNYLDTASFLSELMNPSSSSAILFLTSRHVAEQFLYGTPTIL